MPLFQGSLFTLSQFTFFAVSTTLEDVLKRCPFGFRLIPAPLRYLLDSVGHIYAGPR